ncbi:MAG: hypothetical protein KatS3mg085_197 [Candidatus Dojkabacteria bacterium]|nr:MAG: hypothetical protein KatS3mg085_197 [Candidatus Dojkabacteria bacterium]
MFFQKLDVKVKNSLDYTSIQKERGLAFYLISKNARVEIVPNPKYKIKFPANYLKHKKLLKEKEFFLEELHRERKPLFHHFSEKREWITNWIHSHL